METNEKLPKPALTLKYTTFELSALKQLPIAWNLLYNKSSSRFETRRQLKISSFEN